MKRELKAIFLLILLGLNLPAVGSVMCLCLGDEATAAPQSECCEPAPCCEAPAMGCGSGCGESDCHTIIPKLPEATEPPFAQLPHPLGIVADPAVACPPARPSEVFGRLVLIPEWLALADPPARLTFGVWRL